MARTAGVHGVGAVLTGIGRDGAAGLKALRTAGGFTIVQDHASAIVDEAPAAARVAGAAEYDVALHDIPIVVLNACAVLPSGPELAGKTASGRITNR
jgi:two-component system chemotaxis response regulator CheB